MAARIRSGIAAVWLFAALLVPAYASADVIDTFLSSVHINDDGSADVTEDIGYDFGDKKLHGIYRDIPVQYRDTDGALRTIDIDSIAVTDAKLSPYVFESFANGDTLRIKIGDPNVLVTGKKTYKITYVAHDVVGFFDDHDELYWNVTGNDWQFPIRVSGARIYAPASTTAQACYVGPAGSSDPCGSKQSISSDGSAFFFVAGRQLNPGEGLTVAVGFPKGFVKGPSTAKTFWKIIRPYSTLLIPLIAFVILFRQWWLHGRDEKGRGTIVPEYDAPQGLSVAMISELLHGSVQTASLSALVIVLAIKGYLKIHREEETSLGIFKSVQYRFEKLKAADDDLAAEERAVYEALFSERDSVTDGELKSDSSFVQAKSRIQKLIGAAAVSEGYYRADPLTVKGAYLAIAAAILIGGFMLGTSADSGMLIASMIATAALVGLFGLVMPARTKKGALAREQILGLKEYLQIAEKNRLDFHNAPEKSPELFEKLLPFAMVLGVSEAWAKEFEDMQSAPPKWYDGGTYPVFTPVAFAGDMKSLSGAVAAVAAPTSHGGGSGGGGFSGGGFGGGGGGSW